MAAAWGIATVLLDQRFTRPCMLQVSARSILPHGHVCSSYLHYILRGVQLRDGHADIRVIIEDDQSSEDKVHALYSNWTSMNLDFLIGPIANQLLLAMPAYDFSNDSTPLVLSCCASAPSLWDGENAGLFSLQPSSSTYFARLLRVLRGHGVRTVQHVLEEGHEFLGDACNISAESAGHASAEALDQLPLLYTPNSHAVSDEQVDRAMAAAVDTAKTRQPGALVACVTDAACGSFIRAAYNARLDDMVVILPQCAQDAGLMQSLQLPGVAPALQPYSYMLGVSIFERTLTNTDIMPDGLPAYCVMGKPCWGPDEFALAFMDRYGELPTAEAASAFASLQLAVQAVALARRREADAYRALLLSGSFSTIIGSMRFFTDGIRSSSPQYMQFLPNGPGVVSPDYAGKAELQAPPPSWEHRACVAHSSCGDHGWCLGDGSCHCMAGWMGPSCNLPTAGIIVVPVVALALLALLLLGMWQRQVFTARHQRMQQVHDQEQRELAHAVTQNAIERTMTYALHELGNPVHIMAGSIELLSEQLSKLDQDGEVSDILHTMHRAARHMRQVLAEMRLQRVHDEEACTGHLQMGRADVAAVLRDVRLRMTKVFGIHTTARIDAASLSDTVVLDELRARQLLLACTARLSEMEQHRPGLQATALAMEHSDTASSRQSPQSSPGPKGLSRVLHKVVKSRGRSMGDSTLLPTIRASSVPEPGLRPLSSSHAQHGGTAAPLRMHLTLHKQIMRGSALVQMLRSPMFTFDGAAQHGISTTHSSLPTPSAPLSCGSARLPDMLSPPRFPVRSMANLSMAPQLSTPSRPHLAFVVAPVEAYEAVLGMQWRYLLDCNTCADELELPSEAGAVWAGQSVVPTVSTCAHELLVWHVWSGVCNNSDTEHPRAARLRAICDCALARRVAEQAEAAGAGPSELDIPDYGDPNTQDSEPSSPRSSESSLNDTLGPSNRQFDAEDSAAALADGSPSHRALVHAQNAALQTFTMTLSSCYTLANRLGGCLHVVQHPQCMAVLLLPDRTVFELDADSSSRKSGFEADQIRLGTPGRRKSLPGFASAAVAAGPASHRAPPPAPTLDATESVMNTTAALPALVSPGPDATLQVLVVDDERANVRLTCRRLARLGYTARSCTDGDEVLPFLEQNRKNLPRLILMDIVMKRCSGLQALSQLKAAGYTMPVVAMTANTQHTDLLRYDAAGFVNVLRKPFNTTELRQLCTDLLS